MHARLTTLALVSLAFGSGAARAQFALLDRLFPDDGEVGGVGSSVDADGAVVVAGAPENSLSAGAAYVFERDGDEYVQSAKLIAPINRLNGDRFGESVAISGDVVCVGAPVHTASDGVRGGSVCVYGRSGETWLFQDEVLPPFPMHHGAQQFGAAVALHGTTLVVGAPNDFDGVIQGGAAYVFERSGGEFIFQQKLVPAERQNSSFGVAVDVRGGVIIVGDEDFEVAGEDGAGAAYVFVLAGGEWEEQCRLFAADPAQNEEFGHSVATTGQAAIVGVPGRAGGRGAAVVFEPDDLCWAQAAELTTDNPSGLVGDSAGASDEDFIVGNPAGPGELLVVSKGAGVWSVEQSLTDPGGVNPSAEMGRGCAISGEIAVGGAVAQREAPGANATGAAVVFESPTPCSGADLAEPFGQLDFSDVVAFLAAFGAMEGAADLAEPFGQLDFSDVVAFLGLFAGGCP